MTRWRATYGQILDLAADGLICSANPSLNLSGGVGGAILLRYGDAMQSYLHEYLRSNNLQFVPPGSAVVSPPFGASFKWIAHAVAIDAFYETSERQVVSTYQQAIAALLSQGCKTIVAACLGCGYGRLSPAVFVACAKELAEMNFNNLNEFTLVSTNEELISLLRSSGW